MPAIHEAILHNTDAYGPTANALSTSASIFDIMSDIDGKFGKIADKECDSISSEVKKWFKKLAVSCWRCLSIILR